MRPRWWGVFGEAGAAAGAAAEAPPTLSTTVAARGAEGWSAAAAAAIAEEGAGGGLPPSERASVGVEAPAPVPSPQEGEGEDMAERARASSKVKENEQKRERGGREGKKIRVVVGQIHFFSFFRSSASCFAGALGRAGNSSASLVLFPSASSYEQTERGPTPSWRCASWRREPATAARPTERAEAAMRPRRAHQTLSGASPTPCSGAPQRRTRGRTR